MKKFTATYQLEFEANTEEETRELADEYLQDALANDGQIEWDIQPA